MHPYRNRAEVGEEPHPPSLDEPASDDFVVAAMLLFVGGLGLAIGIIGDRAMELGIGLLIFVLGVSTLRDGRRQRIPNRRG